MNFTNWDYQNAKVPRFSQTQISKVQYKYTKSIKSELARKINFLTKIKSVDGILFIKLKLKLIQLRKEIFLLEIEQGEEVLIPQELSMN